jgi:hypothetical protein
MYVYMPVALYPDGSRYKYYTFLQKEYGGIPLMTDRLTAATEEYDKELDMLQDQLKTFVPDLVFLHGDWCRYYQIANKWNLPYILFEQDVYSLRAGNENCPAPKYAKAKEQEKEMVEGAAGVVFTSEDHRDYCLERYDIPNHAVVYLRPLKQDLAFHPLPKLPGKHLVYAGGIVPNSGAMYGYRDYTDILQAFIDADWTVHVYTNKIHEVHQNHYRKFMKKGLVIHDWLPYPELIKEMSQYTAGLQAYRKEGVPKTSFNYTQTCRPNKVWDYLAANIPTIGLYPGNCARIYQDGGWGIVAPDTKPSTLRNLELPSFPDSLRFEQVMENDLGIFDEVIERALRSAGSKKAKEEKVTTKKGEVEEVTRQGKHWFRLEKPVMENGRLLHGRGKRIPIDEAIRLGLYKKDVIKKEQIMEKADKRNKDRKKREEKKAESRKKKETTKVEVKPLIEPPEKKEAHRPRRISVPATLEVAKPIEDKEDNKDEEKERDN